MKKLLLSLALALPIWASAQVAQPESVTTRTMLDRTGWTGTVSSEATTGEGDNGWWYNTTLNRLNALDGNVSTYWHSKWQGGTDPLPHTITVNMTTPQTIGGVFLTARQSNNEGRPKGITIETSPTGVDGSWTTQVTTDAVGTDVQQNFDFTTAVTNVQFIRLTITSLQGGPGYNATALAEIGAYTKTVNTPDLTAWTRVGWTVTATDKDNVADAYPGRETSNLTDNNDATYWEADWRKPTGMFPRTLLFDFGTNRDVNKFTYTPRGHVNSSIKTATLSYSLDGNSYTTMPTITWLTGNTPKTILIGSTVNIRYVKIEIAESVGDAKSVALAEFRAHYDQILPVELSSFTAKTTGSSVNLAWSTASEVNASHFNVTRSTDGVNFTTLAKVDAAGNATTTKNYRFVDATPNAGTNYYQLQQVDLDGKVSPSKVVSVSLALSSAALVVKSVSASSVTLAVSGINAGKGTLTASNALGQTIASQAVDFSNGNTVTVNTGATKGLIIFTLTTANGTVSKKIVK